MNLQLLKRLTLFPLIVATLTGPNVLAHFPHQNLTLDETSLETYLSCLKQFCGDATKDSYIDAMGSCVVSVPEKLIIETISPWSSNTFYTVRVATSDGVYSGTFENGLRGNNRFNLRLRFPDREELIVHRYEPSNLLLRVEANTQVNQINDTYGTVSVRMKKMVSEGFSQTHNDIFHYAAPFTDAKVEQVSSQFFSNLSKSTSLNVERFEEIKENNLSKISACQPIADLSHKAEHKLQEASKIIDSVKFELK